MEKQKLNFRMLMPFDSNRPVAPLNYLQWLFNADGYDGILIRILSEFSYEEYDKFTYICFDGDQIIRYDIEEEIIYTRDEEGDVVIMETVEQIMDFFKRIEFRAVIEKSHECTYGIK
jgi:hypothetical protein